MPDKIKTMTAFVSVDEDGNEGVCATFNPGMGWMPMVGADHARVESFRDLAKEIARTSGKPVKLVRFSVRSDLETIT